MTALVGDERTNGEGEPDESWLNADIRAWANTHGVPLGSATTKDDMLTVIREGGVDGDAR